MNNFYIKVEMQNIKPIIMIDINFPISQRKVIQTFKNKSQVSYTNQEAKLCN
jgi:hypothetical protein